MTNHLIETHDGVTVVVVQKATPALTFDAQLFFKVGAGYESKDLAGISHFLEHSVFLGTKKHRNRRDVELNLLGFGGTYNAATGVNATSYMLSGALDSTSLENGVSALMDLSMEATLDDEVEIKKEKKVVLSELDMELNQDGGWADQVQVAYETLFKGTVLEQSVLGSKRSLKNMSPHDLQLYHALHYHKERSCLALVTPLPPEDVMRRISKVQVPRSATNGYHGSPRVVGNVNPSLKTVKCIETTSSTWDLDFFFDFPKPKNVKEFVALKLMTLVLFHSELSALFGEARKKGLVYMAHGVPMSFLDTYIYRVVTNLAAEKAVRFWKIFRKQVKHLLDNGLDAVFLEFCKAHFYYSRQVLIERYDLYATRLVEKEFLKENTYLPDEEVAVLGSVTEKDILDMMRGVFSSPRRVVTVRGPQMTAKVEQAMNKDEAFLEPIV